MIHEIIMTTTGNEYVIFQINKLESILMHRKYKGIRINLTAKIKNTKTPFHIDIGIEDVIIPKPLYRNIPVQLDHFESPIINTYSLESTIAEKIDAIINRMEFSSRMKDYYDIYYLATMYQFDGRQLQEALYETLQKRQTSYERDTLDKIQLFHKNKDIQIIWNNFIRGTLKEEIPLEQVLEVIYRFLNPIFNAIISETEFFGQWNRNKYY